MKSMTFGELVTQAATQLSEVVDSPRLEAEILLAGVLDKDRTYIIAHPDYVLDDSQSNEYRARLSSRLRGEPYAYVVKQQEFWSIPLKVTRDVLIPRPDTEVLVEQVLAYAPVNQKVSVLDLGTGSGAIAIALLASNGDFVVTAVDQSAAALSLAKTNASQYGLDIQFICSDWFSKLSGQKFDVIVSNPPYIAAADPHLEQGDLRFEPKAALVSGDDGLDDLRAIIQQAPAYLNAEGRLFVEHGYDQAAAVAELFQQSGFAEIKLHRDLSNNDRATSASLGTE